jgi:hypothetical protein
LPALEAAFAPQDHASIPVLEQQIGPMIHWGLAFAESADAFQALLLESQMARLSGVLNTSAADYLAGQLAASLGIDGASLVTSARQPQQTPTRDPEQLLRAVLHSPLGGAARRVPLCDRRRATVSAHLSRSTRGTRSVPDHCLRGELPLIPMWSPAAMCCHARLGP